MELRERADADPVEQMRDWQRAAEDSYQVAQLVENSGEDALRRALAASKKETDLSSMLEAEEKAGRPNNAPANVAAHTLYGGGTKDDRWKLQQAVEAKAALDAKKASLMGPEAKKEYEEKLKNAEMEKEKVQRMGAPVKLTANDAMRRALALSEVSYRREMFLDNFGAENQPDEEEDDLMALAKDLSKQMAEEEESRRKALGEETKNNGAKKK